METLIRRYLAGEAISRLARESGIPYGTLRQRLIKFAPPARQRGQQEPLTALQRFEQKYIPEPNSGCWLWIGNVSNDYGYGSMFLDGRQQTAQRAAWQLLRGPIPDGLEIDHKCRNPSCVNPDHLRPVTKSVNLAGRILTRETCYQGHPLTTDNIMTETVNGVAVRRCRVCRDAYKKSRLKGRRTLSAADDRRIRAAYESGTSIAYLASEFDLDDTTISRAIKRAGGSVMRAAKAFCPRGHELSGENLLIDKASGARRCRQCRREQQALASHRHYEKRISAIKA